MTFSILMPSYNYGHFIGQAVRSATTEELPVEILVQDGASTDDTLANLEALDLSGVRIESAPDRGQSDALNLALSRASGDVVGWLNADEFYLPGALPAVEAVFSTHPDVAVVHGDVAFVDADGRFLRLLAGYPVDDRVLNSRGCVVPTCATFVRREAIGSFQFDTSVRVVMDWDFYLYLRRRPGRWAHLGRPLAGFRIHPAQVTADHVNRFSDEHAKIAARYALPTRSPVRVRVGDWRHRLLKAWGSGFRLERAARALAGRELVTDVGATESLDALLRLYGPRLDRVTLSSQRSSNR